jgi:hypothetical protein
VKAPFKVGDDLITPLSRQAEPRHARQPPSFSPEAWSTDMHDHYRVNEAESATSTTYCVIRNTVRHHLRACRSLRRLIEHAVTACNTSPLNTETHGSGTDTVAGHGAVNPPSVRHCGAAFLRTSSGRPRRGPPRVCRVRPSAPGPERRRTGHTAPMPMMGMKAQKK